MVAEMVSDNGVLSAEELTYLHILYPQFRVFLLRLQFQLNVQQCYLWLLKLLPLHFKPSVGEGLLESHTINKPGFLK